MIPAAALVASVAAAAQVALQLDNREVRAGETVGLTLQVVDARLRVAPRIEAPPGLKISFEAQTTTPTILNFETVLVHTLRYEVAALEPGDYSIGPVKLAHAGGELVAPAVKLRVGPRPAGDVNALVASLGDGMAYVGEVLVYHLSYKTTSRLVSARWGPPEVEGLTPEPSVEPVTAEYDLVNPPGRGAELWYAYRASKAGKVVVPAGVLQAQFAADSRRRPSPFESDPFFGDLPGFRDVRTESVVSGRLSLDVQPLPAEGQPTDFSGLVGQFVVTAVPSATRVNVGDTVTLDVTVEGSGPLSGFSLPPWSIDGLRVYDDTPATSAQLSEGRLKASATFKRALVPERPGTFELPPLALNWFDPETGAYARHDGPPLALEVGGEATAASVEGFGGGVAARPGVESLGDDILPVRTDPDLGAPLPGTYAWTLLLPGALLLSREGLSRLRPRGRAAAASRFGFGDLPAAPEARLAGLERIFVETAAARIGCAVGEVNGERVATLGDEALALFRALEAARYRGHGEVDEARLRAWVGP